MDEPVIPLDQDHNLDKLIDSSKSSNPTEEDGEQPEKAPPPPQLADPEDA